MLSTTLQAWALSMTSGLASALGAATLYLDPLLHAAGVPSDVNILDSHTVLSAMLAGASGIMAYTSISALTRESIDYLSRLSSWSWCQQFPGALAAAFFLLGAYLNLLLVRLVSYIMPVDSPIKHSCASHAPSPESSQMEIDIGGRHSTERPHPARNAASSGLAISGGNSGSASAASVWSGGGCGHSHNGGEQQPLLSQSGEITAADTLEPASAAGDDAKTQRGRQQARSEVVLRHHHHCECHGQSTCPDLYIPGANGECEYACTRSECYQFEHCHITPLYPHAHTHSHLSGQQEGTTLHWHGHCYSPIVHDDPENYQDHHHHYGHQPGSDAGDSSEHHHHSHHSHHNSNHHHAHEHEPMVQLSGPGNHTASEVSDHHQRLLLHVGLQTAIAIALHKIPEGLIIFLSRKASPKLGLSVAASLFFHNLPEGLMLALPLFLATGKRNQAFLVSTLMGAAPPVIGAAIASLMLGDTARDSDTELAGTFGIAFGITAGMMCMVSLNGMLPTARIYDKSGNVVAWWFAFGVAAMLFANSTLK